MLVLARKASEAIKIGDDITVKVIAIRGGQVKIGIEAPSGVRIVRIGSPQPARIEAPVTGPAPGMSPP
jgi:carbon storage regulator CsrA